MFRFKQFTVDDALCAMKVGTDGVLLGAWAPLPEGLLRGVPNGEEKLRKVEKGEERFRKVLDVGTGSGLIALMIAQRMEDALVLGIDVDEGAVRQAEANFAASPWAKRLQVQQLSLQELAADESRWGTFDLIVSNPPYFVDSLKNPDAGRRLARHTDTLSLEALIAGAARLLTQDGTLALILPAEAEQRLIRIAKENTLSPYYITRVHTREGKPAKRVLMALASHSSALTGTSPITGGELSAATPTLGEDLSAATSNAGEWRCDTLVLQDNSGAPRSAAYQNLCRDFYL